MFGRFGNNLYLCHLKKEIKYKNDEEITINTVGRYDDGAVDETDLDMVVSYVMNPSDDFNKYAADINNDDKVDVADIVLIVKMIKNY
jgi:hypothetical protein